MSLRIRSLRNWLAGLGVAAVLVLLAPWAAGQSKQGDPKETPKENPKDNTPAGNPSRAFDVMVTGFGGIKQVQYINELIEKGWKDNKITPSERCTDYEFIRRASLDIIGRIAKVEEIRKFMDDPPERRRSLLIERLLASEDYANNWSNLWTVLLLTRTNSSKTYQLQMHEWLKAQLLEHEADAASADESGKKSKKPAKDKDNAAKKKVIPDWSAIVTELISAQGKTNTNQAVNFVLAHLGDPIPGGEKKDKGAYEVVPVTSRTTRLFLGLRTQCVQCHDHPFNGEWQQKHFWGINAFYRQVDTPLGRPMMGKKKKGEVLTQLELIDNSNLNPKGLVPYERRSGVIQFTNATFLDGKKMELTSEVSTRRQALARFIVESPYFGKAYVNRTWAHFFGKSFTKDAPDDFGEHNPVSNEELLNRLAHDWAVDYKHNPKDLIRWICNSRAYGLSSVANKTNDKPEDEIFFSRMLLKVMSPEQLFDSLMTATQAKVGQVKEDRMKLREEWLEKLIVNFGDDEGNEGSFNGTVVQALLLMNGQDINNAIMDKEVGTVANVLRNRGASKNWAAPSIRDLFLAALNRPPTEKELNKLLNVKTYALSSTPTKDVAAFWIGYYQDIFWAILNSNEFILNH